MNMPCAVYQLILQLTARRCLHLVYVLSLQDCQLGVHGQQDQCSELRVRITALSANYNAVHTAFRPSIDVL